MTTEYEDDEIYSNPDVSEDKTNRYSSRMTKSKAKKEDDEEYSDDEEFS